MIILPDKNIPRAKFLMPVSMKEWREPSISLPRDQLGNPVVQTKFCIRAKTHDGVVLWTGWFDDREDFDAFLWAVVTKTLNQERALWNLAKPMFPGLPNDLVYEFVSKVFLTGGVGSNATYTSASDWDNLNNHVVVIGAGGSGAAVGGNSGIGNAIGGGGGACSIKNNYSFAAPGTTQTTYQNGTGPTTTSTTNSLDGTAGGDSWFGATTFAGVSGTGAAAKGGDAGLSGGYHIAGLGGDAASGYGDVKVSGGNAGSVYGDLSSTGGGGAGGPGTNFAGAAGNSGVDIPSGSSLATNGGSGDGGAGGTAGSGVVSNNGSTANGGTGGNGGEIDATHGSGGGGGGATVLITQPAAAVGGSGGNYGGGGGGAYAFGTGRSGQGGAGIQGIIALIYTPKVIAGFNSPMLGM